LGYLTPVQGALLQEVIDVAVILNALRALLIVPRQVALVASEGHATGQDPQPLGSDRVQD
jgi:hypothetical protein